MNRLVGIGQLCAVLAAAGCTSVGNEYVYQSPEEAREMNRAMVLDYEAEQATNGVIRQKSIFSAHFEYDAPGLNELGERDLTILAQHYKDNILPYAGKTEVIEEVKVYFDYDKSFIRPDAHEDLNRGGTLLESNPGADIIITGRADVRGTAEYNEVLAENRAQAVRRYLLDSGVSPDRVRVVSRANYDAIAPDSDEVGMQEDRHAIFKVANLQDFPVYLNVKQGDASDELYQLRKKTVRAFLQGQGVDTDLLTLVDGLAGGDGMPSQQAVVFLLESFTGSDSSTSTETATAQVRTGSTAQPRTTGVR